MANRRGKGGSSDRFPLLGLQNHCEWWLQPWSEKMITSWQESDDKSRWCVERQRHYSANKGPYKAMVFPVVMYGCESWTVKKAECLRIDTFKPWCWRRILKVPWTTKRSNQSILREINPDYSLEGLMLKLKLQYFGHLMWTDDSLEKSLMLGKIRAEDEMAWWHHRHNEHELGQTPGDSEGWGSLTCCSPWGLKESDMIGWLNNTRERTCTLTC